jgi:hypothetical protein
MFDNARLEELENVGFIIRPLHKVYMINDYGSKEKWSGIIGEQFIKMIEHSLG